MRSYLICTAALLLGAGCVHIPKPGPGDSLPPGAPAAAEILRDIAKNDRIVKNFSANGTITMRIPGEPATQRFTRSTVRFQDPDRFFVGATKAVHTVRIYAGGRAFLLDHRSENIFYYGEDGDQFPDVALELAPSLILREFFLANILGGIDDEQVAVRRYDTETRQAELEIYQQRRRRTIDRVLVVERGPDAWQVIRSIRLNPEGETMVETKYEDYAAVDGLYMPRRITSTLPDDRGLLGFEIQSNPQVNRQSAPEIDGLAEVRATLLSRGYQEVRGEPAGAMTR